MHSSGRGSRTFGSLLAFFRERAGLSQEGLGKRLRFSKSQIAMVERGQRRPKWTFVLAADAALGAQEALIRVAKSEFGDEEEEETPYTNADFDEYLQEEETAASIRSYQSMAFPGLLQTEEYARAVNRSGSHPTADDEQVEQRVAMRMKRQALFHRKHAPDLTFVLEESSLTRPLGGRSTLKGALGHILELSTLRHVRVQVLPHSVQSHPGILGYMTLLETGDHRHIAYVEGHRTSRLITAAIDVSNLSGTYGVLQSLAFTPDESRELIAKVAQEL
ncbi:helix-turn-helix domain-containing protein [Streptomyces sp. NPDC087440]|uniref:helix-turn-helix domain-containing protein n=1 Tax=Streptomyces sp. NPDC087440 TaxID=3365790 RepID=UPI0037F118A6